MEWLYGILCVLCAAMSISLSFIDCRSRFWLAAFMGFLSAYLGLILLDSQPFYISPTLYVCLLTIVFLPGPLLLGYIGRVSTRNLVGPIDFIPALLPIVMVFTCADLIGHYSWSETVGVDAYQSKTYTALFNFISAMAGIVMLSYVAKSFRMILHMKQDWASYQSQSLPKSWYQMTHVLVVIVVSTLFQVASAFIHPAGSVLSIGDIGFVAAVLYFLFIALQTALRSTSLVGAAESIDEVIVQADQPLEPNISLAADDARMESLAKSIAQEMEAHAYYLQDNLSLSTLSDQLNLTPHKVSEALNSIFNRSFYEFVNDYRVKYAAEQLIEKPNASISDVFFSAGFTTKSTFYGYFKKAYGCTPSEFRKRSLQK